MLRRREWLAAAALLPGCAAWQAPAERIVDTATGRTIGFDDALARMRSSEQVLLGELHDNPWHHAARARVLQALGRGVPVVAEHLPRGAPVGWVGGVEAGLVAAGFDRKGWGWPLHRPLFDVVAASGARLAGGNAPQDLVRRVAREGRAAVPAELLAVLDASPLDASAQAALDADLVAGHCGQLPASRLPGMRWAQRVRDASMRLAMDEARAATGAGSVVLLAGNGHVRRDYGVPKLQPPRRSLCVGFAEDGVDGADGAGDPADLRWVTPRAERADPCAGLKLPAR